MTIPVQKFLHEPEFIPPLEPGFRPAALFNRAFQEGVKAAGSGVPLILGLERTDGSLSRFETRVFPDDHPDAESNLFYCERILKFLLWQRGGWRVYVGGPPALGQAMRRIYSAQGERAFDYHFMGEDVYLRAFSVVACAPDEVPPDRESERSIGRHLDGCRIGFDLGASDLKVSAVVEGEAVFATEIEWNPRDQSDPGYHKSRVKAALQMALEKLPRLDAIGGSSAGVYIENRPMIASLFRGVPKQRFDEVRNMFLEIEAEMGVPLVIVNDGEVTALAGSMSLNVNAVLGIAMGSSEAGGYVTPQGNITNWLNELAFAPIDYNPHAPVDEWSGDRGCGASYLSQQCVFRLATRAGVDIPSELSKAQKLKFAQEELEAGNPGARDIWKSMGIYAGYAVAHYASFYELQHVLILGRCTSGSGGGIILEGANQALRGEFPELARKVTLHLPDELSRRVGQSIAAASLPEIQ
ncbi:MAG: ROK family protein [Anaerolineales bacterium]|nr:ROK family protein [Anaerolineales bacterium]